MTCAICWDDMDMQEFKDSRESTTTCYKLECHHAFHTKCIIGCMSQSRLACPLCNTIKTPQQEMEHSGYARKLLCEILRSPDISELRNEFRESRIEYRNKLKVLKNDVQKFALQRSDELKIDDHRVYFLECLKAVRNIVKTKCKEHGNKYLGSYYFKKNNRFDIPLIDRIVTGEQIYWRYWRNMTSPRLYVHIKVSKKRNESIDFDSDGDDNISIHSNI